MDKMEFYNKLFIDTMEKYMKARGVNIKEADLVAAACDYCDHQKVLRVSLNSIFTWIPFARHYNPLLIRNRSRILTIHKDMEFFEKKLLKNKEQNGVKSIQAAVYNGAHGSFLPYLPNSFT